ncbi:hypothetical protein FEM48_Zijuj02G0193200 [Ziziphus jujuba var. spinosa]|uniref:NAC domain-containing protein n=1 Tax=Ziziphus jujuba var. spinosa TaxID=714518 RepID=A0A978VXI0_ZIZJJ|nr:hypothetical protein FEM48_Zijuj02G0193200 [Ziziphus jujuba var. spinosa]
MESFGDASDFHREHEFQFVCREGGRENMKLQPGFRFVPRDHELVGFYLKRKLAHLPLPPSPIVEVNLHDFNPEELSERYKRPGEKECYFFTPRNRKYKNGNRSNRAAGDGYWKATGADKPVKDTNNVIIGFKKSLSFFRGKPREGEKTNWVMYEFRVIDPPQCTPNDPNDMKGNYYGGLEKIVGEPMESYSDNFVQIRDYYANQSGGTYSNDQSLQNHQLPVLDNQSAMDHNKQLQMVDYYGSHEELQQFELMNHNDFGDLSRTRQ